MTRPGQTSTPGTRRPPSYIDSFCPRNGPAEPCERERDRSIKLPRYAAAGIPEAWLFDLTSETIAPHSEPRGGRYSLIAVAGRGDTLTSTVLLALTIDVDAILGSKDAAE